jgi:hypothetical protein
MIVNKLVQSIKDMTSLFEMTSVTMVTYPVSLWCFIIEMVILLGMAQIILCKEAIQIYGIVYIKRANWNYKN